LIPNSRRDGTEEIVPDAIQIGQYADEDTPPTPAPVLKGDERFFFWIQIEYRGPFSSGHKTSACWQFDAQGGRPTLYGGPKYNYQT
jgi:hypothetical protein